MISALWLKNQKSFNALTQLLVVLSLTSLSIGTLPNLDGEIKELLMLCNEVCAIVFTLEYIVRFWAAEKKTSYIFSFYGIVDLLSIIPFYLSFGVHSQALRALKLLRLLAMLKLVRNSSVLKRIDRALLIAKEELLLFTVAAFVVLYIAATGIYFFENPSQPEVFKSIFHSLWWAVATLTTVGYGDAYPITVGGKIFTSIILIIGLGIVSIPAAIVASALSKAREMEN